MSQPPRTKTPPPMLAQEATTSQHFGEKLRRLRKIHGWSQDELGIAVGIHGRHVGKYEAGKVLPNAETLLRIAKVFQVSLDFLLRDEVLDEVDPNAAIHDQGLLRFFIALEKMDNQDRVVVTSLIDAYIKKQRIEEALTD